SWDQRLRRRFLTKSPPQSLLRRLPKPPRQARGKLYSPSCRLRFGLSRHRRPCRLPVSPVKKKHVPQSAIVLRKRHQPYKRPFHPKSKSEIQKGIANTFSSSRTILK